MRYKLFGRSGLRVSELALGTMTFGEEWGWGADRRVSQQIFDAYAEAGGNFIDTANRYTEGSSESYVGEFIQDDRDHFVVATKYSLYDREGDPNFCGNHRKNMIRSVEGSLRRLDTDHIDLLWVHMWDFTTPVDEVMRALDDLVRAGKVHYIGISDTPAWVVAQANTLAELRGWTSFAGIQVEYSLVERSAERDLLPMAQAFGLAVTPWAPLGAGLLTGKYQEATKEERRLAENSIRLTDHNLRIAAEVVTVAKEVGASPAQVALSWLRQQPYEGLIPIVGARRLPQIRDSLGCLEVTLAPEQLERLHAVSRIELGFPHEFLQREGIRKVLYGGVADQMERRKR